MNGKDLWVFLKLEIDYYLLQKKILRILFIDSFQIYLILLKSMGNLNYLDRLCVWVGRIFGLDL